MPAPPPKHRNSQMQEEWRGRRHRRASRSRLIQRNWRGHSKWSSRASASAHPGYIRRRLRTKWNGPPIPTAHDMYATAASVQRTGTDLHERSDSAGKIPTPSGRNNPRATEDSPRGLGVTRSSSNLAPAGRRSNNNSSSLVLSRTQPVTLQKLARAGNSATGEWKAIGDISGYCSNNR